MLFIIVGPSGSGKTTFIKRVKSLYDEVIIITVYVSGSFNRNYEKGLGRRNVSEKEFHLRLDKNEFNVINEYDNSKYGYSIPHNHQSKDKLYLLDYPGEYPDCSDLGKYKWSGILLIPSNKYILSKRLLKTYRGYRLKSALEEFDECIEDIKNKKIGNDWIIINSDIKEYIDLGINELMKKFSDS